MTSAIPYSISDRPRICALIELCGKGDGPLPPHRGRVHGRGPACGPTSAADRPPPARGPAGVARGARRRASPRPADSDVRPLIRVHRAQGDEARPLHVERRRARRQCAATSSREGDCLVAAGDRLEGQRQIQLQLGDLVRGSWSANGQAAFAVIDRFPVGASDHGQTAGRGRRPGQRCVVAAPFGVVGEARRVDVRPSRFSVATARR